MNEKLKELQKKIDELQLRERILILLCVLAVVVVLLQSLIIDPVLEARSVMKRELKSIEQSIAENSNEQQMIAAQLAVGVNRNKVKRRDQLQQELDNLDERIQESVVAMIPPKLMPRVLENVLTQNNKLKLTGMENRPVVTVIEKIAKGLKSNSKNLSEEKPASQQALYRHSFVLTLEGNYLDVIGYFKKLEKLPWRFYWDEFNLKVTKYPTSSITLEVHTVSMSEEWIGV